MQIGMIGLGRMGANLVRRLMGGGHECVVYDVNPEVVRQLESEGAVGSAALDDFVAKLTPPRAVWVMVPAAFAGDTIAAVAERLERGDIVIDGGNSYYRDDIDRARALEAGGRLRRPGALRHAQGVRRPRREGGRPMRGEQ